MFLKLSRRFGFSTRSLGHVMFSLRNHKENRPFNEPRTGIPELCPRSNTSSCFLSSSREGKPHKNTIQSEQKSSFTSMVYAFGTLSTPVSVVRRSRPSINNHSHPVAHTCSYSTPDRFPRDGRCVDVQLCGSMICVHLVYRLQQYNLDFSCLAYSF